MARRHDQPYPRQTARHSSNDRRSNNILLPPLAVKFYPDIIEAAVTGSLNKTQSLIKRGIALDYRKVYIPGNANIGMRQEWYCDSALMEASERGYVRIVHEGIFLDTSSNIQNGRIHTKLYEKPLNKHITLLFTSNNPKNQKSSTIISQLYRSIIINDRKADHNAYRKKLIQRQRNRGYPAKVLRHILRKKNIPKYSHRDTYLKKQLFKHKQRYYDTILQYQQHITDYTEWPIGE
eukprot:348744_1